MQVGGQGGNEILGDGWAVIRTVADAVFLPSPRHVLALGLPTTRPCRRAGLAPDRRTVDSRTFKSVESLIDMVILLHDRLTASHIECLKLDMVNLFVVGVVFKDGDHDVSDIHADL